ncbi:DNA-3-methyladenine glycosylase I [Myroides sp. LJL119]
MTYCDFVATLDSQTKDPNKYYHDCEYGFEIDCDNKLFERFVWEINQAGLSWTTILKKRANFHQGYDGFEIAKVAQYGPQKIQELLQDNGIIRNRLKVNAAIYNANQILKIQSQHGSFKNWLYSYKGYELDQWVKLFKKNFKFVGPQIVNEFLMSIGILQGAHHKDCPIYDLINNR